jgi:membrane fusion protein (multidrug efflux system)
MKNIRNIAMILLAASVSATLQNCGTSKANEEKEEKSAPAEAISTETFTLQKQQLNSAIRIPGELIAYQQVDLYVKMSSFVRKLHADVGTEVKQGQILASLEAPEITAQLSGSESRLRSQEALYQASKANYERLLETSKTPGTVSQNDLDVALAKQKSDFEQLESARSASREITDHRNYLEIRAPFSGIITARNVSTGAYVGPSGKGSEFPLFTLADYHNLRLVVSVPEAYTSHLKKGSEVEFTVRSLPNQNFSASVSRLAGALDVRLRAQRTEMDVPNSGRKLLPGMIAEVSIPLISGTPTFAIPKSALLNSPQGIYVIKVVDQKAKWIPVKTGSTSDEKTEVFGDIQEGDVLIKTVTEEIRDQSEIKNQKLVSQ